MDVELSPPIEKLGPHLRALKGEVAGALWNTELPPDRQNIADVT